jgi:hypothetical protein
MPIQPQIIKYLSKNHLGVKFVLLTPKIMVWTIVIRPEVAAPWAFAVKLFLAAILAVL